MRGGLELQLAHTPSDEAAAAVADGATSDTSSYYEHLLSHFQGDFDNYHQVVEDRKRGLTPGEGGGHEHIHCTLVPCPQPCDENAGERDQWILAAFYFNGNPRQIFRFRAYRLMPPPADAGDEPVRMKLYTLLPALEQRLRQCSEQPCSWWEEAWDVWRDDASNSQEDGDISAEEWERFQTVGVSTLVDALPGCDVLWDPNWDPEKHPYLSADEYGDGAATPLPSGQSCHATMEAGQKGAIVDSISMIPGKRILIKDELSLWKDEFWINDRGYDPDAEETNAEGEGMPFVYGNRWGVPYKLKKSSEIRIRQDDEKGAKPNLALERYHCNEEDLQWTLGEEYRTPDMYETKMHAIGVTVEASE